MATQLVDANGNAIIADVTTSGNLTGTGSITSTLRGQAATVITVSGTWVGTLVFEGSVDNFANSTIAMTVWPTTSGAGITSTTANGSWIVMASGLTQFRVRCSAFTSGTIVIAMNSSQAGNEQTVIAGTPLGSTTAGQLGQLASGAVTTAAPAYTTAQNNALSLTTAGALRADINSIIGTTAVAASAGVLKVGIAGGAAGAAIDGAIAAAPPANALQIGIKAATANPTNATAGNQVAIMGDKAGRQVITTGNVRELIAVQTTTITASTAETTIVTAGGAGVFCDLSHLSISTTDAAAATVTIKDATAGTTRLLYQFPNAAAAPNYIISEHFNPPIPQATANNNWTATVSVNAGSVTVNCVFVKNL